MSNRVEGAYSPGNTFFLIVNLQHIFWLTSLFTPISATLPSTMAPKSLYLHQDTTPLILKNKS